MTVKEMTTLDRVEQAIFALRTSTRREQAKAAINALRASNALGFSYKLDMQMIENWNRAIDLILEEKA